MLVPAGGATYFLFDCPGQVELFTDHPGFKALLDTLTNTWHYRLTAVHLVDAHLCCEPSKWVKAGCEGCRWNGIPVAVITSMDATLIGSSIMTGIQLTDYTEHVLMCPAHWQQLGVSALGCCLSPHTIPHP